MAVLSTTAVRWSRLAAVSPCTVAGGAPGEGGSVAVPSVRWSRVVHPCSAAGEGRDRGAGAGSAAWQSVCVIVTFHRRAAGTIAQTH